MDVRFLILAITDERKILSSAAMDGRSLTFAFIDECKNLLAAIGAPMELQQ